MGSAHRGVGRTAPGGQETAGTTAAGTTAAGHPPHELSLEEAIHQVEAEEVERPPAAGPATAIITAVVVVALGAAALVGASSLGPGSPRAPGAGMWPLLIAIVLVVLGIGLALTARHASDAERFSRTSLMVLAGLVTMIVFVAVIGIIGFEIPAALLCFVWLRFLGHESWRTSVITSLVVVVAFYLLFVAALAVPIPHLF